MVGKLPWKTRLIDKATVLKKIIPEIPRVNPDSKESLLFIPIDTISERDWYKCNS